MKVVYHGPRWLVKYDHTNARLRIVWTYGVSLKSQVRVQKQRMIRHHVNVSLAGDRRGGIACDFVWACESDLSIAVVSFYIGRYASQIQWIP